MFIILLFILSFLIQYVYHIRFHTFLNSLCLSYHSSYYFLFIRMLQINSYQDLLRKWQSESNIFAHFFFNLWYVPCQQILYRYKAVSTLYKIQVPVASLFKLHSSGLNHWLSINKFSNIMKILKYILRLKR